MTQQEPCALLDWDSTFFARRIGRLRNGSIDPATLAKAERWCRAERVDVLYFLAPIDDPATAALAEAAGFQQVDERVTLARPVAFLEFSEPPEPCAESTARAVLRPARPADVPELRGIAAVSHRDSRFYADPHFARERCDELYATWIEKSCAGIDGASVFVAEVEGRPAGYVTTRLSAFEPGAPRNGEIGLIAVAEEARGRGLGGRLVARALVDLAARGASSVSVVTQGGNLAARRLYERLGFAVASRALWFHRWFA